MDITRFKTLWLVARLGARGDACDCCCCYDCICPACCRPDLGETVVCHTTPADRLAFRIGRMFWHSRAPRRA